MFILEFKVPEDVISGDYKLTFSMRAEPGAASYEAGKDFKLPAIHIENRKTFVKPDVSVQEQR